MDTFTFIQMGFLGLLGISIQVFVKINVLKKECKSGNLAFSVKKYFSDDWPTLAITATVVIAALVMLKDYNAIKDTPMIILDCAFLTFGYMGSSIAQAFFSSTKKKILSAIDQKTGSGELTSITKNK